MSFFYNLIISPISNILEFFYVFFSSVTSKGLSVIALSFVVTLFCLPLYIVAENWQEQERRTQKKLKPWVDKIKKTFKGDEQYMILNAYYRQNNYRPIFALRSSFSLLIQIPFFIAAYTFLSNVESLKGYSFLFIKDFGAPDHFAKIGNLYINILPILMTAINCISGVIYSKGHAKSEKIQIFASAAIFLLLLYNSPAGLVVYWTMNNILSLIKNVFFKLKNPAKVFHICCCIVLGFGVIWAFSTGKKIYIVGMIIIFAAVLFYFKIKKAVLYVLQNKFAPLDKPKNRDFLFFLCAFSMAFLVGAVIPSFAIESSPANFCYIDNYKSPFVFLFVPFVQALGLYVFWPACFYKLFSKNVKKAFSIVLPAVFICSIVNCFIFSGSYGALNDDLTFMHEVVFPSLGETLLNFLVLALIFAFTFFLISKKIKILNYICSVLLISCLAITVKNVVFINSNYKKMDYEAKNKVEPIFHFSKDEKNVLVIMEDACVSPLVAQAFKENPKLAQEYDGFTFYPNTVSSSYYTQIGAPALFGGYDFTPYEINKREGTIQQKHNQALLTMPTLFYNAGFQVTVSDLPYENYGEEPVAQIYNGMPNISRHITKRVYNNVWYKMNGIKPYPILSNLLKRNFAYLGLFKIVPPFFRPMVFHRSYWMQSSSKIEDKFFDDSYSTLDLMPLLSDTNSQNPSLIIIDNETTHEARFLNSADYSPFIYKKDGTKQYLYSNEVTEEMKGSSEFKNDKSFHAANAILSKWNDFFDYLRKNNCYDNTRIIIVSDHGQGTNSKQFENDFNHIPFMKESVTATLLVKDFYSHGNLKIDNTFMTNSDTPALATEGIIKDAKNPFTGNALKVPQEKKSDFVKISYAPVENLRSRNNKKFKIDASQWYTVKDDIFREENWSRLKQ